MSTSNSQGRLWPSVMFAIITLGIVSVSMVSLASHPNMPVFISRIAAREITVDTLLQGSQHPMILIDVRSPSEYLEDHIGNSPLVPYEAFQSDQGVQKVLEMVQQHTQTNQAQPTVVVYCQTGPRSIRVYHQLHKQGVAVVVLQGGIVAWRKQITPAQDQAILMPITSPDI